MHDLWFSQTKFLVLRLQWRILLVDVMVCLCRHKLFALEFANTFNSPDDILVSPPASPFSPESSWPPPSSPVASSSSPAASSPLAPSSSPLLSHPIEENLPEDPIPPLSRPSEYLRQRCPLCFGGQQTHDPDML